MTYLPEQSKVFYRSKGGKKKNIFDALEWLAVMSSHIPNKGESRKAGLLWILQQRQPGQTKKTKPG